MGTTAAAPSADVPYAVQFADGSTQAHGSGAPSFTFFARDRADLERLLNADAYTAASAFISGELEVEGDLVAAIRFKMARTPHGFRNWIVSGVSRLAPARFESWLQSRDRAARNIRFHYDRSNDFYRQFLDSRMVYSSAYFGDPAWTLEDAQLAKIDRICKKLDLQPGERFLDIGSGWGAVVMHAAEHYGVQAIGCTLSRRQYEYSTAEVARRGLRRQVTIFESDYRDLPGTFDKIASDGMFEHVGRRRLRAYFETVYARLSEGGRFLNAGLIRSPASEDDPQTLFMARKVFPGGELAHLPDVIRDAERAGFEVIDVEDRRIHYALTCREWIRRLQQNRDACLRFVDAETYRTWMLYLAGSCMNLEDGKLDEYQLVVIKRRPRSAPVRIMA